MKTAILTVPSSSAPQEVANPGRCWRERNSQFFTSPSAFTSKDVVVHVDLTSELKPLYFMRKIRKRKSFYENQLLGLQERKTHPDDDIMMSYAAKKALWKALKTLEDSHHPSIDDQEMASHYISMIDKSSWTGGQNVDPKFMVNQNH